MKQNFDKNCSTTAVGVEGDWQAGAQREAEAVIE
jgi:hypothetical protein